MATCMQWQIVSPGCQDVTKWIGKTGLRGCCRFIPRVADLVVKGVHDAAGTLLRILSIFYPLYGTVFVCSKTGEDLCRKLVVAIAV